MLRMLRTVTHQKHWPTWPLPPSISRTGRDTTTSRLLAPWMSLSPTLQVRPPSWRGTSRPRQRPLLHSKMECSPWPGFATPLRGKRLRQANGGLLLKPVYMTIQESLTRRNHIFENVKKGELWSPELMMLPGSRIKHVLNMSWVPNSFEHSNVQNVMNLEK